MTNQANPNTCPKCGAAIPADAPQGLCPKCVLLGAAATEAGISPTATAEIPSLERVAAAFPQLQILELLGRGGMGFVFKARQPHLDRFVALKLLPDKLARDPHFAERFGREGRVLAKLNHPGIVSIYDFGQTGGFYFLLMEYVDGVNLRQAMQAGKFSPAAALAVVPKICEALQYAHEQGVLHRDIKPANILLDARGRVKIADFGIAKLVGDEKPDLSLTATGAAIGTPQYMAPEQLEKPGTVDHRADIYSLGVVFYEMLTGELPIGRFSPPSERTLLDPRVDEVVMRTLEKEREKRYQSAGDVKTNVEHLTEAGAGGEGGGVAQPVAPDFILCHPQLPRMAQLLTVYALVIAPALWFIGLVTMDSTPHPNAYAAFVEAMMRLEIFWGELIVTVLLFIGGWKLRALRASGTRFIRAAIWMNLGFVALAILGVIWIELLAQEANQAKVGVGEAVLTVAQLAAVIFQIVVLFWLRRNRKVLDSVFQTAARASGPRRTMVIPPRAMLPSSTPWSKLAVAGAVLTGISMPVPLFLLAAIVLQAGGIGAAEVALMLASVGLFGVAGTILGWMGLSNIRASRGTLRGLPLAVFAALAWPLLLLVMVTVGVPTLILIPPAGSIEWGLPWQFVILLVPAGTLTFGIWAVYAAVRWGGNHPPAKPRGVLKWVFLGLMSFAIAALALGAELSRPHQTAGETRPAVILDSQLHPALGANDTWIRFTFTAVELREVAGKRWLAIDYLDHAEGECQKSFPWESKIPGFKPEIRTSEFLKDDEQASPAVRHQRIEYLLPDSASREQLEQLRLSVEKALKQKTIRLELGEQRLLVRVRQFQRDRAEGMDQSGPAAETPVSDAPHTSPFAPTRWTLVLRARGESVEGRAALSELCEAYYQPVLRFLRRDGRDEDAARELAHDFFARVLAGGAFDGADPERGRFRSYVLGALKHFLADQRAHAQRLKRGGGVASESLDAAAGSDTAPGLQVADGATDRDSQFDREWALTVMDRALAGLQKEFGDAGKADQFETLKPWLMGDATALSQADAARQLDQSEGAVKVMIHRMRKRFREVVRAEISQTLNNPTLVDEELRHLIEALV